MNKKVYFIFTKNADGTATKQPVEKRTLKTAIKWIEERKYDIFGKPVTVKPAEHYVIEMEYNAEGVTTKKVYEG